MLTEQPITSVQQLPTVISQTISHQSNNQSNQNISGFTFVGNVVELRIDEQPINKIKTTMNGHYEFLAIDMPHVKDDHRVEVAIYENTHAKQPVAIKTINLKHNSEILHFVC